MIEFSVKDSGIGIQKDAQDRLFQSFTQVDGSTTRRFGGTGLGLAICKSLCEKMGGRIWVESDPGHGAKFSFTFKAGNTQAPAQVEIQSPLSSLGPQMATRHPLRILIAEDNRINQLVATGLLSKLGYAADVANDGKEALALLESKSYDLIFMDCHMPELDGFEATRRLIEKLGKARAQRIIALTASTMQQDIDRCFSAGMDGFLGKPIVIADLIRTLADCPSPSLWRAA